MESVQSRSYKSPEAIVGTLAFAVNEVGRNFRVVPCFSKIILADVLNNLTLCVLGVFLDANCYIWSGWAMGPYCTAQGSVCD